jgi:putative transcriptional regulator
MINHHPSDSILKSFAAAELPASVSVAVAIHNEMCEHCRNKVQTYTEQLAHNTELNSELELELDSEFLSMMDGIIADESKDYHPAVVEEHHNYGCDQIKLPTALQNLAITGFQSIGKLARSRVELDDGAIRSSLLQIEAGGDIPSHTHNGFEVTVLLDGSFQDEMGSYNKGDFIWLDSEHSHNPTTSEGCLCYAVVSDSLHFTQGLSRLLNPIGKLIY